MEKSEREALIQTLESVKRLITNGQASLEDNLLVEAHCALHIAASELTKVCTKIQRAHDGDVKIS